MDWVTSLSPGGDKSFNAHLVLVHSYSKTPIFLPCNQDDTAMDTAIMIWNRFISHTGLFKNIISDRDPKFTSALWKKLHKMFGTKLSFSTAYHPQTDNTSNARKGWNPILPYDTRKEDLVDIQPTARSFKNMLDKARHHANRCMQYSFKYEKGKWEKYHKPPDFKVRDLVLVSTLNFNNIKGPKKLKESFSGTFMIIALLGPNAVQLELTGELMNQHPSFPISLTKPYSSSERD
ncbi:hypothetical protein O181_055303 [Austropuccinia psidii MF-1]|uniref:Integrase catalytic domain-containing protein n=1 Tax=Austropuccinia psidii MF-1 TaxID=1389203 RepID=A0A9Q3HSA6_9BASI|nr:hypothetical protein [Austropuccinia psidii MF-1]